MRTDRKPDSTRDIPDVAMDRPNLPPTDPPTDRVVEPAAEALAATGATAHEAERHLALFPEDETGGFRTRWEAIQTGFVDEPRAAVEQADALVAQVLGRLTDVFTRERTALEQQWHRGDNVSTEDLRVALKRYRSFFDRLLTM